MEGQISLDILIFSNMTSEEMNESWKGKKWYYKWLKTRSAILFPNRSMIKDQTDCANQPGPFILWNFTSVAAQAKEAPISTLIPL